MQSDLPIGVFDSGVGGLTVLERLQAAFPSESFLYVADQGYCPYGTKPARDVENRVRAISKFLSSRVKAIVIGCNTASLYLASARQAAKGVPVVGVIEPTARAAAEISETKRILLLATPMTVASGAYQQLLNSCGASCVAEACPEFVTFVESSPEKLGTAEADELVSAKFADLPHTFDTVLCGCTHFGLLAQSFQRALGNVNIVTCGDPVANLLSGQFAPSRKASGTVEIYTTGQVEAAKAAMRWFTLPHKDVARVEID